MANVNSPMGFRPYAHKSGGAARLLPIKFLMTDSTTIREGDLLIAATAGTVEVATVDIGTAAIGVAASYKVSGTDGTDYMEIYGPDNFFEVQADAAVAQTDMFFTANHVATAGSSTISAHQLDASDLDTGLQLKLWGLSPAVGNIFGLYNKVIVTINENLDVGAVAGV